jgi:hypothetical protein
MNRSRKPQVRQFRSLFHPASGMLESTAGNTARISESNLPAPFSQEELYERRPCLFGIPFQAIE